MDAMEMRRNAIAELVNKHGTVSFSQIKEQFPNVSEMTLRTDLKLRCGKRDRKDSWWRKICTAGDRYRRLSHQTFGAQHTGKTGDCKKGKTSDPAGYRYFSGFRKYNDRTCPDFSGSVQSDLYHRTFLCNGTCQFHKACHHADRRTVETATASVCTVSPRFGNWNR